MLQTWYCSAVTHLRPAFQVPVGISKSSQHHSKSLSVAKSGRKLFSYTYKAMAVMCSSTTHSSPLLVAFDFDHTIVDGNTDTWITKAVPGGDIPSSLKASYITGQWTAYMGQVLAHMHSTGVAVSALQQVLQQLPYTAGMEQLMQHLQEQGAHCIILSDSNSCFIDWILTDRGHNRLFSKVYTNPATITDQGKLLVSPYHSHHCKTCPVNMCKRIILKQHLQQMQSQYSRVAYVGDGGNDLCPALALGHQDILFVRSGYALDKLLQDTAVASTLKAEVVRWQTAHDILQRLLQL